ncbi:MAG: hypothetical protein AMXMBFR64_55530 [Myxococcales bacterium]
MRNFAKSLLLLAVVTAMSACAGADDPSESLSGDLDQLTAELGAECVTKEEAGKCLSLSNWNEAAAKQCAALGMELTAFKATAECGSGRASAVIYTCCPPNPDPCETITRTTKLCQSEATWLATATKTCESKGMILSDFAVSGSCGKGRWNTATFRCCPDTSVCCATAAGPQILPASKCPSGAALPPQMCKSPEVCCKLQDGSLVTLTADQCKLKGGAAAPLDLCKQEVCCKTSAGPQITTADQCPASQVVSMDLCKPVEEVCCKINGGYFLTPSTQCPTGQTVPMDLCKPVEEVCCKINGGYFLTPSTQCPTGQTVPMDLCKPVDEVCCKIDGGYFLTPSTQCPAGQTVPMDLCKPVEEICCLLPDGTVLVLSADACKQKGGVQTSMSACDPTVYVCCETAAGYQVVPSTQCPNAQVPMDYCKPKEVCCKINGGYFVTPATQCPAGQAVSMDLCQYTPCDKAIFGQCKGFDYTAQCDPKGYDCGPLGILGDLNCDGVYEVCLACPPGTHPVDSNGDGCEDLCDCCPAIKCPAGTVATDTDGDGCPDTCVSVLCDKAIFGQCKGFDYTAQCDPSGFDCTSFAILGDTNCDGKYDVCIECPAGTVPMDLDGDGCEEVCNCPADPNTK